VLRTGGGALTREEMLARSPFEYDIDVTLLNRPIGSFRFVAKIGMLVRRDATGDVTRLSSPAGEFYGHDRGEALNKARRAMEDWIATQQ
jgi:hypothetical protein